MTKTVRISQIFHTSIEENKKYIKLAIPTRQLFIKAKPYLLKCTMPAIVSKSNSPTFRKNAQLQDDCVKIAL